MKTSDIIFEFDGQQFEVSSRWLRDEAQLGYRKDSMRGAVLKLLEGQLADEWAAMGPRVDHDDDGADDVHHLEVFSRFVASIRAHVSRGGPELCVLGWHSDERKVDAGYVKVTERELERLERGLDG